MFCFFFSSRRRHTRLVSDWSSDVCSSDLDVRLAQFAVKYDDGLVGGLTEADIVLVGVSRTSKTPLSIYLGYLGYRAANVPLVKGIDPPAELFEIDPAKIVGLKIDAKRLAEIRRQRARRMGGLNHRYSKLLEVYEELEQAEAVQRRP